MTALWRARMYEHLVRNPGINGWQICQPVTINMCRYVILCISAVSHTVLRGINIPSSTASIFYEMEFGYECRLCLLVFFRS